MSEPVLKNFSVKQIEDAFAMALKGLTGTDFTVDLSSIQFEKSMIGFSPDAVTAVRLTETPDYVAMANAFGDA